MKTYKKLIVENKSKQDLDFLQKEAERVFKSFEKDLENEILHKKLSDDFNKKMIKKFSDYIVVTKDKPKVNRKLFGFQLNMYTGKPIVWFDVMEVSVTNFGKSTGWKQVVGGREFVSLNNVLSFSKELISEAQSSLSTVVKQKIAKKNPELAKKLSSKEKKEKEDRAKKK